MADETTEGTDETTESTTESGDSSAETTEGGDLQTITVDGVDLQVTPDELKTLAQKGKAADKRFQEAATERRKVQEERATMARESEMLKTIQAAQQGDEAALLRLADYPELNVNQDEVKEIIEGRRLAGTGEAQGDGKGKGAPQADPEVNDLRKQVSQMQAQMEQENNDRVLVKIRGEVDQALASDEVLGYLREKRPKALNRLAEYTVGALRNLVVDQRRPYGPDVLQAAVHRARQYAEEMGIRGSTDDDQVPGMGLGRSPSGLPSTLGRSGKPPARIPTDKALNTGDYAQNVFERLAHDALRREKA